MPELLTTSRPAILRRSPIADKASAATADRMSGGSFENISPEAERAIAIRRFAQVPMDKFELSASRFSIKYIPGPTRMLVLVT